jgi:glutamyl-tRNA synthetase
MTSIPFVTRFAPSPTGMLHLGNARTALLSYLAARKTGGRFILRIEDTDEARSQETYTERLFEDLRWLGLEWDEGPDVGGPHPPYRQQQRRAIYEEWLQKLDAMGLTYPCFCTPTELNLARKRQLAAGKPPRYAGTCRNLTAEQREERSLKGLPAALRFRVPTSETVSFNDLVHGEQKFNTDDIGDFIIQRTDGSTAFFFSNAVDDSLMGVTLVLRGDDHMTNTPRQLLILQALGLPTPQYAHVALLLGMDGSPLSKRHGAMSLQDLRDRGFLAAAVSNHLARLGHTCVSDGFLDATALVNEFDITRLGKAAAKFDEAQLLHWQKEAVAHLSAAEFRSWIGVKLPEHLSDEQITNFLAAIRHNVAFPSDAQAWADVIFGATPLMHEEARVAIQSAGADFFARAIEVFGRGVAELKENTKELGRVTGRKGPGLFMPLRAALTGATHGPELAPIVALLSADEIRQRLSHAQQMAA